MTLTFREVIEDLRNSLQLSDAQNLALQVTRLMISILTQTDQKIDRQTEG